MFRKKLADNNFTGFRKNGEAEFNWRSKEISRIEGLSDAVFAFAITLLVVSLEVPKTFDELLEMMRGFAGFAISFVILYQLWYEQYIYFRRYGIDDTYSVVLNAVLLFTVLFFVYPLKFLWSLLTQAWMGLDLGVHLANGEVVAPIRGEQMPLLMIIYGLGVATTYLVFTLLYRHALRHGSRLNLTPLETHDTKTAIGVNTIMAAIGGFSALAALVFTHGPLFHLSWLCYPLIGPIIGVYSYFRGKKRRPLMAVEAAKASAASAAPVSTGE